MFHCKESRKNTNIHYYKIGVTCSLPNRLREIQTDCPLELNLTFWARFKTRYSAEKAEKETHLHFRKDGIRGEWFQFRDYSLYRSYGNYRVAEIKRVVKYISQQQNVVEISEQITGLSKIQRTKEGDRYFIKDLSEKTA